MEFGKSDHCRKFFFDEIHSTGAAEGVLEAFGAGVEIIQTESGGAMETRSADDICFIASLTHDFPSVHGESERTFGVSEPEQAFRKVSIGEPFTLLVLLRDKERKRSL
jgi:hypothetical protein